MHPIGRAGLLCWVSSQDLQAASIGHILVTSLLTVEDAPELQVDIENLHVGLRERAPATYPP